MKKFISAIALLLLFCVMASCSACKSCSSCGKKLIPASGGDLYDKKTGVTYKVAPPNYEAISWEKEVYMEDKKGIAYHRVLGANGEVTDPPIWLYNYDLNRLLYNSNEVTLPTLSEMNPDSMSIYMEEDVKVYLEIEEDKEVVKEAAAILDTTPFPFSGKAAENSYRMSFASDEHPYITYNLIYMEYAEDQYEYVSLKGAGYETKEDIESNYDFIEGVPYEIIEEEDGTFVIAYNRGKYFIYDRYTGQCYMAKYINDLYTTGGESDSDSSGKEDL